MNKNKKTTEKLPMTGKVKKGLPLLLRRHFDCGRL